MTHKSKKPSLATYEKYDLEAMILEEPDLAKWFAEVCSGSVPQTNIDETILALMEGRGLVRKIEGYWTLGHDGREFARKLGLILGPSRLEIDPSLTNIAKAKNGQGDISEAWAQFYKKHDEFNRNRIMEHYLYIVKESAERICAKLPGKVDVDDLVSVGIFGLMDAVDAFNPDLGCRFEIYASERVRGSILDELRNNDWVSRLIRARPDQLDNALQTLETHLGRMPIDEEIAKDLGLGKQESSRFQRDANAIGRVLLNKKFSDRDGDKHVRNIGVIKDQESESSLIQTQKNDIRKRVTNGQSRAERLILILYYYEEMTMKEIASTLELSESRVSQMHSAILAKLKNQMNKRKSDVAQ